MDTFAFIIHPINPKRDVSRKFPLLGKYLTENQINFFSTFFPPIYISEIEGIRSDYNQNEVKGWFIAAPYTPKRMLELPERMVYRKIIQTGRMAEKLGAKMLGLGAYTSVVGDAGITIAKHLDIPVTTGDAYTVAIAIQAIEEAAQQMEIPVAQTAAAVVGATGAIGKVCSEVLASRVSDLYLIGRRQEALDALKERLQTSGLKAALHTSTSMDVLKETPLILTVTSDIHAIIHPEHLQPGSIICDVARPRDVSARVAAVRDDVLVIDGGMVNVPGLPNFNFDFGFPEGKAYACMAETIALALESRYEDYTLGKDIHHSKVEEIDKIAKKHGFKLSGFRSFEKAVTQQQIQIVRERAQKNKKGKRAPSGV